MKNQTHEAVPWSISLLGFADKSITDAILEATVGSALGFAEGAEVGLADESISGVADGAIDVRQVEAPLGIGVG